MIFPTETELVKSLTLALPVFIKQLRESAFASTFRALRNSPSRLSICGAIPRAWFSTSSKLFQAKTNGSVILEAT